MELFALYFETKTGMRSEPIYVTAQSYESAFDYAKNSMKINKINAFEVI